MPNNKAKSTELKAKTAKTPAVKKPATAKKEPASKVSKVVVKKTPAVKKETLKAEVVAAKPVAKKASVKVDVLDITGKVAESISLPGEIFSAKVNPELMAQAVRVYLANQRAGTVSTKTRGEVRGSTRKIYRQKGTGRARHGGVRAPIFVKGGVAHGPKPRDYSLSLSKKMRKASLFSALTAKLQDKELKVVTGFDKVTPKTKEMAKVLHKLAVLNKNQKVLMVVGKDGSNNITRSVRNIEGVTYAHAEQLNTYDVLNNKVVVFLKDAVDGLEKHFAGKGRA